MSKPLFLPRRQEYLERGERDEEQIVRFTNLFGVEEPQVREAGETDPGSPADPWFQGFVKYPEAPEASPCVIETHSGIHKVKEGPIDGREGIEAGHRRGGLAGRDREGSVPVSRNAIVAVIPRVAGIRGDLEGAVLDGHPREHSVHEGDEAAADTAPDEIDCRSARPRVDHIGPYVDLVEGDGRGGDVKSLFGVALEDDEREEAVPAVCGGRHETAGDHARYPFRGKQVGNVEHVSEGHHNGRNASFTHDNETIPSGPVQGNT